MPDITGLVVPRQAVPVLKWLASQPEVTLTAIEGELSADGSALDVNWKRA